MMFEFLSIRLLAMVMALSTPATDPPCGLLGEGYAIIEIIYGCSIGAPHDCAVTGCGEDRIQVDVMLYNPQPEEFDIRRVCVGGRVFRAEKRIPIPSEDTLRATGSQQGLHLSTRGLAPYFLAPDSTGNDRPYDWVEYDHVGESCGDSLRFSPEWWIPERPK